MATNGSLDAVDWMEHAPADVVARVRAAIAREPTPRALRRALYRAMIASDDELTRRAAERSADQEYASAFGIALLRAWPGEGFEDNGPAPWAYLP